MKNVAENKRMLKNELETLKVFLANDRRNLEDFNDDFNSGKIKGRKAEKRYSEIQGMISKHASEIDTCLKEIAKINRVYYRPATISA